MVDDTARPDQPPSRTVWARWLWTWSALGTPLVCVAILLWSPTTVLVVATIGAVVGVLLAVGVVWDPAEPEELRTRLAGVPVRALAAWTASGFVALPVLTRLPPWVLLLVVLVGVLTSPWVRARRARRQPGASPVALPEEVEAAPAPWVVTTVVPGVEAMTVEQLCTAWRHSFRTLEAAGSVVQRTRVVTVRQALLDELETRNAPGLRAWLASGARAASSPDRFLSGPPTPSTTWPPNHAPVGE